MRKSETCERSNHYIMEVRLDDWQRILIGDVPGVFYIELVIRAAVIYAVLMISMRVMGKRMSSELSRNEMAAVVSLAAAIGVPLMNADRGLLPVFIIAVVIICYQIGIAYLATKSESFESVSQDKISVLVEDGVLKLENMEKTRISRERLFAELRSAEKKQLGEVRRVYLEAAGHFSIIENPDPIPGLCVLPEWDESFIKRLSPIAGCYVCNRCGKLMIQNQSPGMKCELCGGDKWVQAVCR